MIVDIFFNKSSKIEGFNIRRLKIVDSINNDTIVDFKNSSSNIILDKIQYPIILQHFYQNIETFLLETSYKRTPSTTLSNINITTFRFKIINDK